MITRKCWLCEKELNYDYYYNEHIDNFGSEYWNERDKMFKIWNDKRIQINCCVCTTILEKLQSGLYRMDIRYNRTLNLFHLDFGFKYFSLISYKKLRLLLVLGLITKEMIKE